jgi:hypothetical protein
MIEDVYETIRGILFDEWPKNNQSLPAIYDQVIKKWHLGEFTLVGTDTPAVIIKGTSTPTSDEVYGAQEYQHKIDIEVYVQGSSRQSSERFSQEAARLLNDILRNHRRMWVVGICPICEKSTLSPKHFTDSHNDILSTYVTSAQSDFDNIWNLTHTSTPPTLADSALASAAFLEMYDSVVDITNPVIPNLSDEARQRILSYKSKWRRPVRILYNVVMGEIKTSDGGEGQQLLYKATASLSATELIRVAKYGPDNVSTDSWERR